MKIEKAKISALKLNPANPRSIKDEKFAQLVRSVRDFPQMLEIRPIVVNSKMEVLGGNMRLRACMEAGLTEVPIIRAENLTDDQQREFIIKDNVGFGEWDWGALANEWDAEELADWGLDVPDFAEGGTVEAQEDDYEMPDEIQTDIVAGDLFEIGNHRLLCGDSTVEADVHKLMNGAKADMVFTDPPHNLDIVAHENILHICLSFCLNDIFILTANRALIALASKECFNDFFVHDFVFHIGGGSGPLRQYDLIGHFNPSRFFNQNEGFSNCVRVNSMRMGGYVSEKIHDHQKGVMLLDKFIRHYSISGELVLDLFLGSGTTMVAAHQLNRKCYGMEIDPKYCQVIVDRMLKLDPTLEVKRNGQPYAAGVAETVKKQ